MRFLASAALLMAIAVSAQIPPPKTERPAPVQPLPFSHKNHVGVGLKCQECHPMPGDGEIATLPATAVCMKCHIAIKKDSPHIAKLAELHKEGKKIAWARVYRVPDYVFFSHKTHVAVAGVNCETCHGPVAQREVLRREKDLSMQTCMECHRLKNAKTDCTFCHDQR
jgi:hypothetical protein